MPIFPNAFRRHLRRNLPMAMTQPHPRARRKPKRSCLPWEATSDDVGRERDCRDPHVTAAARWAPPDCDKAPTAPPEIAPAVDAGGAPRGASGRWLLVSHRRALRL